MMRSTLPALTVWSALRVKFIQPALTTAFVLIDLPSNAPHSG
jgi:hypothetical protein